MVGNANEPTSPAALSGDMIFQKLVGSWVVPVGDPDYRDTGAISVYEDDGTVEVTTFETNDCKVPVKRITGSWKVSSGRLVIYDIRDSHGEPMHNGVEIVDKVIQISDEEVILQSERDHATFKRVKSSECQQVQR